jgi:hypothetical protein
MTERALYRLLTFHVPDLMSIFFSLGPRPFVIFRNKIFKVRGCYPSPHPTSCGSHLVGCPRLLIQYTRSYPPCLEVVSSFRNLRTPHAVMTRNSFNVDI